MVISLKINTQFDSSAYISTQFVVQFLLEENNNNSNFNKYW
jgi:hypothetical protein